MEKIRTYSITDARRAMTAFGEVRETGREIKASLAHRTRRMKEDQMQSMVTLDKMRQEHADWVTANFAPRLSFLQRYVVSDEKRLYVNDSLEFHYSSGLQSAMTLFAKTRGESFDTQDVVAGYTANFLLLLKMAENLQIPPSDALPLAQRAYRLDTKSLSQQLRTYDGRFSKRDVIGVIAHNPDSYETVLTDRADKVIALAERPEYHQVPLGVISYAMVGSRNEPKVYLDKYVEGLNRNHGERQYDPKPETMVYKRTKKTAVPIEVRKVGEALRLAREAHFVGTKEIASSMGITWDMLIRFEAGELVDINPKDVSITAAEYIDHEDPYIKEMQDQVEVLNWLRTFSSNKNIPPSKRIGRSIKLLRLSNSLSNHEFAAVLGLPHDALSKWENGDRFPDQASLNIIFKASGLDSLPKNNKAIQYVRLQSPEQNGERENDHAPMTLERLKECDFGEVMRYLRRVRGATHEVLAQTLSSGSQRISAIERGTEIVDSGLLEGFITWCELDGDSNLADILRQKAQRSKIPPSEDTLQGVLTEQYLFQEHIDQLDPYELSATEKDIEPWLRAMPIAKKVKFLRKRKKWIIKELSEKADVSRASISWIESEKQGPKDITVFKLAKTFIQDDIHHPIVLSMLDQAAA